MPLDGEQQKALVSSVAAELVEDGQVIGLGTGTTVAYLIDALGARVRAGLRFTAVPTSENTERAARAAGLTLAGLDRHPLLDLDLDGADEVDPRLDLIKGRGGALLREKIVACAARRFIVLVDEAKPVQRLGERMTVPVEIVPFGWTATLRRLEQLGATAVLRGGEQPLRTDNGNFVLDCRFSDLTDPAPLAAAVKAVSGVVEHGLFLGLASQVLVGRADGSVTSMERTPVG
jgi:ribose 5-phosphate isomerase A